MLIEDQTPLCQITPGQQIRPAQPRPAQRLLKPPTLYLGMIAGQQHRGHGFTMNCSGRV